LSEKSPTYRPHKRISLDLYLQGIYLFIFC